MNSQLNIILNLFSSIQFYVRASEFTGPVLRIIIASLCFAAYANENGITAGRKHV